MSEEQKLQLPIDPNRPFRLNTAYCIPNTSDYLQDRTYQPGELTDQQIALIPPNYLDQKDPEPQPEAAATPPAEPSGATTTTKRVRSQPEATTGE